MGEGVSPIYYNIKKGGGVFWNPKFVLSSKGRAPYKFWVPKDGPPSPLYDILMNFDDPSMQFNKDKTP